MGSSTTGILHEIYSGRFYELFHFRKRRKALPGKTRKMRIEEGSGISKWSLCMNEVKYVIFIVAATKSGGVLFQATPVGTGKEPEPKSIFVHY